MGTRADVQGAVSELFPRTDWNDQEWGYWDSEYGSIEFHVGNEPITSLGLSVRASAAVVPAIVELCLRHGWQALDCSMGDFLEKREDPAEGLNAWRVYRDRVIGKKLDVKED